MEVTNALAALLIQALKADDFTADHFEYVARVLATAALCVYRR